MSAFNRIFVAMLAIAWCVALGGIALLVWDQASEVSYDGTRVLYSLDVNFADRSEQILASIVLGLLALPALFLLMAELMPHRQHRDYANSERRVEQDHKTADETVVDREAPVEHRRWRLFGSHR